MGPRRRPRADRVARTGGDRYPGARTAGTPARHARRAKCTVRTGRARLERLRAGTTGVRVLRRRRPAPPPPSGATWSTSAPEKAPSSDKDLLLEALHTRTDFAASAAEPPGGEARGRPASIDQLLGDEVPTRTTLSH